MTFMKWPLAALAEELRAIVGALEESAAVEQAPHGIDEWSERRLQQLIAEALRPRHAVELEVPYPSSDSSHHPKRCDLVLAPLMDVPAPAHKLWVEIKVAHQYREGGQTHRGYGAIWRRALLSDLRKMADDAKIAEAALVVLAFTQDAAQLERDLASFERLLDDHSLLAGFRQAQTLDVQDRIGHRMCGISIWPIV